MGADSIFGRYSDIIYHYHTNTSTNNACDAAAAATAAAGGGVELVFSSGRRAMLGKTVSLVHHSYAFSTREDVYIRYIGSLQLLIRSKKYCGVSRRCSRSRRLVVEVMYWDWDIGEFASFRTQPES